MIVDELKFIKSKMDTPVGYNFALILPNGAGRRIFGFGDPLEPGHTTHHRHYLDKKGRLTIEDVEFIGIDETQLRFYAEAAYILYDIRHDAAEYCDGMAHELRWLLMAKGVRRRDTLWHGNTF